MIRIQLSPISAFVPRRAVDVLALLAVVALAPASPQAEASADPESAILFTAANLIDTAEGRFNEWRIKRGDVDLAGEPRGFVEIEVDIASLETGIEDRDEHLRSSDFFDVEAFPTASVRVHDAVARGESERGNPLYEARFHVRIRDIEKTLHGEFELTDRDPVVVQGSLVIDRTDFGVGSPYAWWNPMSIENEVEVSFRARLDAASE